ncbi:hypothetical protein OC835_004388 [Tilletia horrida]|nr:hypothetical protein OC835_004388 [Tilletia horrida]
MSAKELCAKPRSSPRPSIPPSRSSTATRTTRPSKFNMSIRFMDATFAHINPKLSPAFARGSPCCRPAECSVIIVQGLVGIDKLLTKRWLDARARAQLVTLGLAFLRVWRIMAMHETTTESDSRDRPWTAISIVLHNAR